jgi:Uncharacterized protein family UPF0016
MLSDVSIYHVILALYD